MGVFEIVAGVILILTCAVIVLIVLSQEPKGQGLSSVITGTEMMSGESRARGKEARQAKITRFSAIIFFIFAILVNVLSLLKTAA